MTAIAVEHLSKVYHLYDSPQARQLQHKKTTADAVVVQFLRAKLLDKSRSLVKVMNKSFCKQGGMDL